MSLDPPLIWAGIIVLAVGLYVLLDGFDLGVGLLFPFARSAGDRDVMMATIAPVWDGNETWLVLGGTGLLGAFPLAYAVILPALYIPVTLMLAGLILRGVAFEFRARGRIRGKRFWTAAFSGGSILAAMAQGFVLGGYIQGFAVRQGRFAGGPFDWATPYTALVAAGLVAGYGLLGATWLMMKTSDNLHGDARRWAALAAWVVGPILGLTSVATVLVHPAVAARWGVLPGGLDFSRFLPLAPAPALGAAGLAVLASGIRRGSHRWPFVGAAMVFVSGFAGLAASFAPFVAPYAYTFRQAAAADNALRLMLAGAGVLLPLTLGYTVFVYWTFRGKVSADAAYH